MRKFFPLLIEQAVMSGQKLVRQREQMRVDSGVVISRRIGQFSKPEVPVAYEMAFAHFCELDFRLQVASFLDLGMDDSEISGVAILRECREEFWKSRTRCAKCGTVA